MSAPRAIVAERLDARAFAPFGRVWSLDGSDAGADAGAVRRSQGPGWTDRYTIDAVLDTPGHLGLTACPAVPFAVEQMERHEHTGEVLFCTDAAIVLAVAPAGPAPAPASAEVRAFVIEPGTAVSLHRGVWHDACRGAHGPTRYHWLATVDPAISDDWVAPDDGPVRVELGDEAVGR